MSSNMHLPHIKSAQPETYAIIFGTQSRVYKNVNVFISLNCIHIIGGEEMLFVLWFKSKDYVKTHGTLERIQISR